MQKYNFFNSKEVFFELTKEFLCEWNNPEEYL